MFNFYNWLTVFYYLWLHLPCNNNNSLCKYKKCLFVDYFQIQSFLYITNPVLFELCFATILKQYYLVILSFGRKYLKTEVERHRPQLGSCLGAFSSTFPVAYLEPHLNKHNQFSLVNRIADHSLEAQGKLCIFTLNSLFHRI